MCVENLALILGRKMYNEDDVTRIVRIKFCDLILNKNINLYMAEPLFSAKQNPKILKNFEKLLFDGSTSIS